MAVVYALVAKDTFVLAEQSLRPAGWEVRGTLVGSTMERADL